MAKTAFITGVNGISGSAILEHIIEKEPASAWDKIIISSRSPLKTSVQDSRITFIALDYTHDVPSLAAKMRDSCSSVTHACFCSYVHKDDFDQLNKSNAQLFENFLDSIEQVAPNLQNVTLQTGGKHYYVHLMPVPSPAREEEPRIKGPVDNFYFPQEDKLIASQAGKKWSWNVIRPEGIVGATNTPNGMNEALTIALYFMICKELNQPAIMPTNQRYWEGTEDVSYAPLIADLTLYASTNAHCANEAFNVTNGDYFSWRYMWPRLAEYFGAEASSNQPFAKPPPKEGDLQQELTLLEWSAGKKDTWDAICEKRNAQAAKQTFDFGTWAFIDWVYQRSWSSTLSMSKARKFGWNGYIDSYDSFIATFERFKKHGLIP